MADYFDTAYQGAYKSGLSLGQGIESAAGDVGDGIKLQKQRQMAHDILTKTGMVKDEVTPPSVDDLKSNLKEFGKQTGRNVNFNIAPDADEKQQRTFLEGIHKAYGVPLPKGQTKTTLNLTPGTEYDPIKGSLSFSSPTKSMVSQLGLMKEQDKKENSKVIADAIQNGDQLADFQSLYGLAGPVKAELEKRGVNVNKMQLDTIAEKKLAQTLNGPQQTRLRQSIASVTDGLDVLDGLNKEFQRTGIKAFNKAQIEALANGSGTKEQQELAQRFVTQITGLQDEFGNVIMSGNAPTDKALELAGKVFRSDYNDTSLSASIKQAKQLLSIRRAAIENVGAVGVRGQIPGQPEQQAQGVLQASGVQPPMSMNNQKSGNDYQTYLKSIGQ